MTKHSIVIQVRSDDDSGQSSKKGGSGTWSYSGYILKIEPTDYPQNWVIVRAMVLPVVIYGCESWTIQKAEGRRIGTF